nr:PREDICTED: uncharacterized protein LOC106706521 isoform X4 [Latimeria chalumnae]|eukprot:XP_014353092.1 PREDICTED: uncharacterized protein LOC106706521 isoform X4 [Latimeria chalumnae]
MMEGDESARGESPGASLGPAAPPQVAGIPLAEERADRILQARRIPNGFSLDLENMGWEGTSPTMKRKMSIDGLSSETLEIEDVFSDTKYEK